jgi:hypothetical protein
MALEIINRKIVGTIDNLQDKSESAFPRIIKYVILRKIAL